MKLPSIPALIIERVGSFGSRCVGLVMSGLELASVQDSQVEASNLRH